MPDCIEDRDTTNSKVFSHCKQAATLKQNLDLINYKSMQVFKELKFSGVPFSIDELTRKLKGKEERSLLLIEYLTSRNEELSRKAGIDITQTPMRNMKEESATS